MERPKRRKAAADTPRREIGRADYSANPRIALSVPGDCSGQRVDQILARLLAQHSRSRLQVWIREGRVAVGGTPIVEPRHKLWGGETIEVVEAPDVRAEPSTAENIPLHVVYEDDSLLVIDKAAGLVVHPGNGNWCGTLLNALLHHTAQLDKVPRAGIVHRLDKDTSGLMVVAKTLAAQTDLVRQLQERTVKRHYQALVRGILEGGGTVDAPVGRHPTLRTRMAVVPTGRPARTHYRVLESFIACTLIGCALETGRTHQIRVHLTALGHPLVGDPVYGRDVGGVTQGPRFPRQALHACRLSLTHPETGKSMSWKSPMPDDMASLIETLRQQGRLLARGVRAGDARGDEDPGTRHAAPEGNPEPIGMNGDDSGDDLPDEQ